MQDSTTIQLKLNTINISVIGTYRPPQTDFSTYLHMLEQLLQANGKTICVGDTNIDLLTTNHTTSAYLNSINSCGHTVLNAIEPTHATRVTSSSSTIIDHVTTNTMKYDYEISLFDNDISDHKLMHVNIKGPSQPMHRPEQINIINYRGVTNSSKWADLAQIDDFQTLILDIQSIIKEHTKSITPRQINVKSSPWISPQIISLAREKEKFFSYKKRFPQNGYIASRYQFLKSAIRNQAKKEYFNSKIETNVNNPKQLWVPSMKR